MEKSSLAEYLSSSTYILALLGAGLSAPSGMPTFRGVSSSGWRGWDAVWFATPSAFAQNPGLVWQFYNDRRSTAHHALPNEAHYVLADIARSKPHFLAITQNIDGLSQKAGHSADQLVELHGSIFSTKCNDDQCSFGIISDSLRNLSDGLPIRPDCGAKLPPGVVRFGDHLPRTQLCRIERYLDRLPRVDLILVIGTSARVFPATEYIQRARDKDGLVAQFNLERDAHHMRAGDWYVPGDVAVSLPAVWKECCS